MALRGTMPVTSEVVGAGAAAAGADAGELDPQAVAKHAAIITINVVVRINPDGSMAALHVWTSRRWGYSGSRR